MLKKLPDADKIICGIAIGYVILPIVIFAFGWTRIWIALAGLVLFCFLAYRLYSSLTEAGDFSISDHRFLWIVAVLAFI